MRYIRVQRVCERCGDDFSIIPAVLKKLNGGKFCSRQCADKAKNRPVERFLARICKTDYCWIWTGPRNHRGYGSFSRRKGSIATHRFSWEIHRGPIPENLHVLHKCDNRPCCNPNHLFLGTHADNMRDMAEKGRSCKGDKNNSRLHPESLRQGSANNKAKISESDIVAIRTTYRSGLVTLKQLAIPLGITEFTVSQIIRRKTWKHVIP